MPLDANGNYYPETGSGLDAIDSTPGFGGLGTFASDMGSGFDLTSMNEALNGGAEQMDANGNWYDKLGNLLKQVGPLSPILRTIATPFVNNIQSGGLLNQASSMLRGAGGALAGVVAPDLMALIPQLQRQVQQGLMTPASAAAALVQVQGTMTPALARSAMAVVQGQMNAEQYGIVSAVVSGQMDPATAQAALQESSMMGSVNSDAASIQGARTALGQLANIAENRGLTEADRAQFNTIMNQAAARTASDREAQLQQLQMQGVRGAGADLAARLSGVQGGANANAAAGAQLAQSAQARALEAMQAGLSGNVNLNQQLFTQQSQKAQAQDAINQFNAAAKQAINMSNQQAQQQAAVQNFQAQQAATLQNAQAGTQAAAANAAARQAAGLTNFNTAQAVAEANAAREQQTALANQGTVQQAGLTNFNTANQMALANQQAQQQAAEANAGRTQQANLTNFNMANQIAGTNTEIANREAMMPSQFADQQFQNRLNQARLESAAQVAAGTALGNMATGQITRSGTAAGAAPAAGSTSGGSSTGQTLNDIGKAVNIGKDLWNLFSDESLKTDKKPLRDDDVDAMMARMTGYKYRYKGSKSNPEQQGVMAQDMERDYGSVIDTPAGKMVQGPEAMSKALAVLANQHERIRKLEGK
jgi:hypothetical protein